MAKRFFPLPAADIPPDFKLAVRTYTLNDQDIAKYAADMPAPSPETIAEMQMLYAQADLQWSRLNTWKKTRWTLCAIKTWGNIATMQGAAGYSGYSLYIKTWLEQRPESDKQPISPCSARVTDPEASPWNYQP